MKSVLQKAGVWLSGLVVMGLVGVGSVQAMLLYEWDFTNSGQIVGPNDVITLEASLTVLAGSEDLNGSTLSSISHSSGSFFPTYDFNFANPTVFDQFNGQTISAGNSLAFTFATYTPDPAPVLPGMFTSTFSRLNFFDQMGNMVEVESTNLFTASVGMQPVPEPSTMLLFASGIAGLGAWRYRKARQNS